MHGTQMHINRLNGVLYILYSRAQINTSFFTITAHRTKKCI